MTAVTAGGQSNIPAQETKSDRLEQLHHCSNPAGPVTDETLLVHSHTLTHPQHLTISHGNMNVHLLGMCTTKFFQN